MGQVLVNSSEFQTGSPLVSVVIPTVNRERELCDTIRYFLDKESYSPFELIVIDQSKSNSPETTAYLASAAGRINYVRSDNCNAPAARNTGVKLARGSIIVFVDDDVRIEEGFLSAHAGSYSDPKVSAVAGMILQDIDKILERDEISEKFYKDLVFMRSTSFVVNFPYECKYGYGANMSIRKEWLERLGGFDENFTGCALGEDRELFFRLRDQGGRVVYNPRARLFHIGKRSGGTRVAERYTYEISYVYCENYFLWKTKIPRLKRWGRLLTVLFNRELNLRAIYYGFSLGLCRSFWVGLLQSSAKINGEERRKTKARSN